jgi:phosphatidylserine decarboxylase
MTMSSTEIPKPPSVPEPIPENLHSVQPGGGVCYRIELAWGGWRRFYLKRFRPAYVRRMAELRRGDPAGAPHEILDPRDLKFCRNVCSADWNPTDDRFLWRERIPFARWGLAELQLMGWPLLLFTAFFACYWWYAAVPFGILAGLVIWFFRDPPRRVPEGEGLMVSPADGKISEITRLDHDEFIGGPAVRIGIFLSIFNVHLNRSPAAVRVIGLRYSPGKFLNAMKPESARENESMWIGLEEQGPLRRRMVVRQIAGAYARRIVCALRPGEEVGRGDKIGMIKLGSRTELILADEPGLKLEVNVGDRVKAGTSVVAAYGAKTAGSGGGA